jgi:hypothetical protein
MSVRQRLAWSAMWTVFIMMILWSCAELSVKVPAVSEMSNLDKATLAMDVYTRMSKDFRTRVALPNLSAAEKEVLGTKKTILDLAGPKIKAFNEMVKGNLPVDKELASWIDAFLVQYRY